MALLRDGVISLVRQYGVPFYEISKGVDLTMHGVLIVAIVFGGIVLALAIIGSTILMAIKILRG
ncbi:MAG: hypothetical protein GTO24_11610, partial [candidate division Zixibacteria bacterium]|nr:hypothetical protein [candidate division Zixibacteria bacterium]